MTVHILNYGLGNLKSLSWALERIGCEYIITNDPHELRHSDKLIIPGVGSFGQAMKNIESLGLSHTILDLAHNGNSRILGICLGMQILFDISAESPGIKGFSIIKGDFELLVSTTSPVPHIGWNNLEFKGDSSFRYLNGIKPEDDFYFVHSYALLRSNLKNCLESSRGRQNFISYLETDNITCSQFHPEKSHTAGLLFLKNWIVG